MADTARSRILVVDDEWLIAASLQEMVQELGHDVLGPAPSVRHALALIADRPPHVALLDVSLGRETSFPIAAVLRQRVVPFAFLTGYQVADLPREYADQPVLGKPVAASQLRDLIDALLAAPGAR